MKQIIYLLALSLLWSCSTKKEAVKSSSKAITQTQFQAQAPQIIYKTKANYSQLVPIQMNAEKTKIVGFPAPSDLKSNGELQIPIALDDGYFYDRRGLSKNSVFLNNSYAEYAAFSKTPSLAELKAWVLDEDPFLEIYSCPQLKQGSDLESMNALVQSDFKNCNKIK